MDLITTHGGKTTLPNLQTYYGQPLLSSFESRGLKMGAARFTTTRLRFRPFTRDDLADLHALWIDPEVRRYLWDDEVIPRQRVESIIEGSVALFKSHGFGLWAVSPLAEDQLIGFCGFWHFHEPAKLELIFGFEPAHWNQGLATEAATAMLCYGFQELSFPRIEGSTDAANEASSRVMERAGMSFWKRETTNGLDTIYYAIDRADFKQTIFT